MLTDVNRVEAVLLYFQRSRESRSGEIDGRACCSSHGRTFLKKHLAQIFPYRRPRNLTRETSPSSYGS